MQNEEGVDRRFLDWNYINTSSYVSDGLDYRDHDLGGITSSESVDGTTLDDGNTNDALCVGTPSEEIA